MLESLYIVGSFIFVISFIVFVHELGHYAVAKIAGVKVTDFAIGFGPKIIGIKDKSGTEWKLCWIPLGGYVKFLGDQDPASMKAGKVLSLSKEDQNKTFVNKNLAVKSAIAVAGPMANFLLAIIILSGFFYFFGKIVASTQIALVEPGSRAEQAGIKVDDKIIEVDGNKVEDFLDIERYVFSHPKIPLTFTIQRGEDVFTKIIVPEEVEKIDSSGNKLFVGRIGVGSSKVEHKRVGIISSIVLATSETKKVCMLTLKAIGQMVVGSRSTKDVGGIVRITKYTAQSVKQGFIATLSFIAMLSINLGLVNLFPIPPLDGGHLLIYGVEAIFGKKKYTSVKEYVIKIGFVLLIALMAFGIVNDIINFNS